MCDVRMSVTTLETCLLWYIFFWVDPDGIRLLNQSSFGHPLIHLDSYVLLVMMYSDVRDDNIMDSNTS